MKRTLLGCRTRRPWLWAIVCVGSLASACGGSNAAFDPAELPAEMKAPYEAFAFHCSRCHTLTRPLTAHISSTTHWDRYVARMRRMPGSGIGAEDERVILQFLYYYSQEIRGLDDDNGTGPEDDDGLRQGASAASPEAATVGPAPVQEGTERAADRS